MDERAELFARELTGARADTLNLFDLAREDDLHESPGFGFRPVVWHLAHIGAFESYWLLQKVLQLPPPEDRYERIFDPIRTPREESKDLPRRSEMEDYLRRVREGSLGCLDCYDFDAPDPLLADGYVLRLVLEHERQHQETLAYLFQLLDPSKKTRPPLNGRAPAPAEDKPGGMAEVPAGDFLMGDAGHGFAYDNERPAREVSVPAFKIARQLTTNEEYAAFVEEGGYGRREFWSEEGWGRREQEGWSHPLHWRREGSRWRERLMFGEEELRPDHPVTGVSWFEAEAYARFADRRLPTEAEWEKAASWDGSVKRRYAWGDAEPSRTLCNFGFRFWGTTPVGSFPAGASHYGCHDMTGNVWEWTSTPFDAFPGFEPFPYPEYSQEWFDGDHRVLKGGSWATGASVLRATFRNFFRRHFRIAFSGIRLAADA
ncbi:MAG TPA: SUMF1/EgtB/PvdO family nonheme iron enzyme [Pyrinomonadaceae bacterium]|nr:SUMF1/EgtB/PvdO family nonheme iron enzyme [Pyrinomonadaceae bacterium]